MTLVPTTLNRSEVANADEKRLVAERRSAASLKSKIDAYDPIKLLAEEIKLAGHKSDLAAIAAGKNPRVLFGRNYLKQSSFDAAYAMVRRTPSVVITPPIPTGEGFEVGRVYMVKIDASPNEIVKWTVMQNVNTGPEVSIERFPDKVIDVGDLRVFRFKPERETPYAIIVDFTAAPPSTLTDRIVIRHAAVKKSKTLFVVLSVVFSLVCAVVVVALFAFAKIRTSAK